MTAPSASPQETGQQQHKTAESDSKPTLEHIVAMDEELQSLLYRRKELDRSLACLEAQLYQAEARYLDRQQTPYGNVVRGLGGFVNQTTHHQPGSAPRSTANSGGGLNIFSSSAAVHSFDDSDRIFSHSSSTHRKSLQFVKEMDQLGSPYNGASPRKSSTSSATNKMPKLRLSLGGQQISNDV